MGFVCYYRYSDYLTKDGKTVRHEACRNRCFVYLSITNGLLVWLLWFYMVLRRQSYFASITPVYLRFKFRFNVATGEYLAGS